MRRYGQNIFVIALLVSLFLHFGTGLVLYFKRPPEPRSQPIEITIVDKSKTTDALADQKIKNDARQIVEQSDKRINDVKDEKAKYLSRFDQKVVNQTKAQNTGKFQNDAKMGLAAKALKNQLQEQKKMSEHNAPKNREKQKQFETSEGGDVALPKMANLKPEFHWDKVQVGVQDPGQVSQSDDHLKDVENGPQTLLSTREFIYYSYYTRIKERLRLFWEPKIKEKVARILASGRHIASAEEKITRLVITLDQKGTLVRVQVLGESGLKDLDDAAIEAFQQAAPFPNPPHGIVEPDGTIKIHWDFILEA